MHIQRSPEVYNYGLTVSCFLFKPILFTDEKLSAPIPDNLIY